jgi:hypothetical protein
MPADKPADALALAFENIDALRTGVSPPGPYSDLASMLDQQQTIEAARAEGELPTKPKLTLIAGDKGD